MNRPDLGPGTQAGKIITKAGGARNLSRLIEFATGIKVDPSAIYRWNYPKDKGGTGGFIPSSAIPKVTAAFRKDRQVVSQKDFSLDWILNPEQCHEGDDDGA